MSFGALLEKKDEWAAGPLPEPDRGDVWIWRCIDAEFRLRIASHLSKTRDIDDAETLLRKVALRIGSNAVLFTSDKLKAYPQAIRKVFASKKPPKSARGAGPPSLYPVGLLYGQVVKQEEHGHLKCVERKAVIGTLEQIQAVLDRDNCSKVINTSRVERDNLSVRQHNPRLVRKTLSYSKKWQLHQASIDFEDALHNFVRPHSSLRIEEFGPNGRKWKQRTPAMAAGLTDHIWSIEELVSYKLPSRI